MARAVELGNRATPGDWLRMASALKWNRFPYRGLAWPSSGARAGVIHGAAETGLVLPSLARPKTATLLACHLLNAYPPVIPTVHNPCAGTVTGAATGSWRGTRRAS